LWRASALASSLLPASTVSWTSNVPIASDVIGECRYRALVDALQAFQANRTVHAGHSSGGADDPAGGIAGGERGRVVKVRERQAAAGQPLKDCRRRLPTIQLSSILFRKVVRSAAHPDHRWVMCLVGKRFQRPCLYDLCRH
jgi:hypothetical protein